MTEIYRDVEGDLWAQTDDGRVWLGTLRARDIVWEGPATRPMDEIRATYAPLEQVAPGDAAQHVQTVTELAARIGTREDQ